MSPRAGDGSGANPDSLYRPPAEFDMRDGAREHAAMQVTLTRDLEEFIARKVQAGGYADASEVVRDALRNFRAKDDSAEIDSPELAEMLLPAVQGRHRPLTAKHFDQLRLRARRRPPPA